MTNVQQQPSFEDHFTELAGEVATLFSFNRSIGKLYGRLFVASQPLSLDEVAKACHMSKGNASIHLRTLEDWGAVHRTGKLGRRQAFYDANRNLKELAIRRIQEGASKRIMQIHNKLQDLDRRLEEGDGAEAYRPRVAELKSLMAQTEKWLERVPKLLQIRNLFPWKI